MISEPNDVVSMNFYVSLYDIVQHCEPGCPGYSAI